MGKISILGFALSGMVVVLSGCVTAAYDGRYGPLPAYYDTATETEKAAVEEQCAAAFENSKLALLNGKIPLRHELPTREMLAFNEAPSNEEMSAIALLESAHRSCRAIKEKAGIPAKPIDRILDRRMSNLRFGLAKGEIPYALYNYGLIQAQKEIKTYQVSVTKAQAQGEEIGQQVMMNWAMQMQSNLTAFNNQMALQNKQWQCTGTPSLGGMSYTCY